jgi:hypothetical protein
MPSFLPHVLSRTTSIGGVSGPDEMGVTGEVDPELSCDDEDEVEEDDEESYIWLLVL